MSVAPRRHNPDNPNCPYREAWSADESTDYCTCSNAVNFNFSIPQETADRDELGSLVTWLRTGKQTIPEGCTEPWLAALERILAHLDKHGFVYDLRYND